MEQLSLARQVDIVFRQLREELSQLSSGTLFMHIRNNVVGKFGLRHNPIDSLSENASPQRNGLNEQQQILFRNSAIQSLRYKNTWTHGEIQIDFAVRSNQLVTSVVFESNYNMAALNPSLRYG